MWLLVSNDDSYYGAAHFFLTNHFSGIMTTHSSWPMTGHFSNAIDPLEFRNHSLPLEDDIIQNVT